VANLIFIISIFWFACGIVAVLANRTFTFFEFPSLQKDGDDLRITPGFYLFLFVTGAVALLVTFSVGNFKHGIRIKLPWRLAEASDLYIERTKRHYYRFGICSPIMCKIIWEKCFKDLEIGEPYHLTPQFQTASNKENCILVFHSVSIKTDPPEIVEKPPYSDYDLR